MSEIYAIRGQVVTANKVIHDGAVVISGDAIAWVGEATEARAAGYGDEVAAAEPPVDSPYILPGLVDVHCHGGGGQSFPDSTSAEQVMTAVMEHRKHGTTSLVASLVTASARTLRQRAELLADIADKGEIAGIHFEGPFVAYDHCGAQDPELIQAPNPALVQELLIASRGHAVTMTIAYERPYNMGPGGVADVLIKGGALPSFGHTDANAQQTGQALREVRQMIASAANPRFNHITATHLFNGMPTIHHRDPGPVLEFLSDAASGGVVCEIIGDGVHVHPDTVRNVYELIGREQLMLVTDAMAAAGMPDGQYRLGSQDVTVCEGQARLTDGNSLAGGTAHLIDVVRTTYRGGVPLVDAVYCASTGPARILKDDTIGELRAGKRADVVIADTDLNVLRVIRRGETV